MPSIATALGGPLLGLSIAGILTRFRRSSLIEELDLDDEWLHQHFINHSFVHCGGQHRGGTTILWEGLAGHDAVAGHRLSPVVLARARKRLSAHGGDVLQRSGLENDGPAPTFEGIFLQDVYPHFGLDGASDALFRLRIRVSRLLGYRLLEGVGSYALSPAANLNDAHPLALAAAGRALFRQWAPHWNLTRPILLEKSPSNAATFGMLSSMWAANAVRDARFVFITRQPIMVAHAMVETPGGPGSVVDPGLRLADLVEHWVAVEGAIRAGARRLLTRRRRRTSETSASDASLPSPPPFALLTLEAVAADPRGALARLLIWLDLPADLSAEQEVWAAKVRPRPNAKYIEKYKASIAASRTMADEHEVLVARFKVQVQAVGGYQLEAPIEQYSQPPTRDEEWWKQWLGDAVEEVDTKGLAALKHLCGPWY